MDRVLQREERATPSSPGSPGPGSAQDVRSLAVGVHPARAFRGRAWPALALATIAQTVAADELIMRNGDRLSGKIVEKTEHMLVIETSYAGKLRIEGEEIAKLTFNTPQVLILDGEQPVRVVSLERDDGMLLVERTDTRERLRVAPGALSTPTAGSSHSEVKSAFSGRANLAFKEDAGNSDKTELDVDYSLTYRRERHRFRSEGLGEFDTRESVKSKQDWSVGAQYDYFVTRKFYAGTMLSLEQKKFDGLDLRTVTGPLVGYQFYESPAMNLLGELGVLYVNESFVDQPGREYSGIGWRVRFDRYLFGESLQFYHNHFGVFSTEDVGNVKWRAFTGFRVPLIFGFVGSTEIELDYDSAPAYEAETLDTTYRLKLGYAW